MANPTPDLLVRFTDELQRLNIRPGDRLLLAVSGGLDSTVLAHLCYKAQLAFRMLHCNFQLRGDESERDASFVENLASNYKAPCSIQKFDTNAYAAQNKLSIQEAARQLRYHWFEEQVQHELQQLPQGFDANRIHVLTAHNANDNIETALHQFARGTGLRGLLGIPEVNGHIKRPLLHFFRNELQGYAHQEQLTWVEDSSNAEIYYTRNFLRHNVLPLLQQAYPQLQHSLHDNIRRFTETEALYRVAVEQFKQRFLFENKQGWQIPIRPLLQYRHTALLYEILRPFGFTEKQLPDVWQLTDGQSGRYVEAVQMPYRIIRHRHWLLLRTTEGAAATALAVAATETQVVFPGGVLKLHTAANAAAPPTSDPLVARLDARHITYPLLLRPWKAGDYFYPLGLGKKKKIARFLIDLKLSVPEKEAVWVLESAERIIWVVGYRIDDRFKWSPHATTTLTVTLQ